MKWILDLLNGLWKKHRFWYWICFILYAILTLLIGVGISLLLTDRFFHLEHTGWSGLSSFSYGNFDKEHFGGYKYENTTTTDKTLKVYNSWEKDIDVTTVWHFEPDGDFEIKCDVFEDNEVIRGNGCGNSSHKNDALYLFCIHLFYEP